MPCREINKTQEEVENIFYNIKTKSDFCKALEYAPSGQNYKNLIKRFNLDDDDLGKNVGGPKQKKYEPIINGMTFGKLTVIDACCDQDKYLAFKSKCQCECGSIVIVANNSLNRGLTTSCGCMKGHRSKGELLIEQILNELQMQFKTQFSFKNLVGESNHTLKFDFAIFENNKIKCLIEFQGEQHYYPMGFKNADIKFEKQQRYDELKYNYCKQNNIPLIIIPFTDIKDIDKNYIQNKILSI